MFDVRRITIIRDAANLLSFHKSVLMLGRLLVPQSGGLLFFTMLPGFSENFLSCLRVATSNESFQI